MRRSKEALSCAAAQSAGLPTLGSSLFETGISHAQGVPRYAWTSTFANSKRLIFMASFHPAESLPSTFHYSQCGYNEMNII